MAVQIGIKVSPEIFEMLFRMGARITGEKETIAVRLIENGVHPKMMMVDFGYNRREGLFYFVFREKGDLAPGPIEWRAPVYEKEDDHGTDPQTP